MRSSSVFKHNSPRTSQIFLFFTEKIKFSSKCCRAHPIAPLNFSFLKTNHGQSIAKEHFYFLGKGFQFSISFSTSKYYLNFLALVWMLKQLIESEEHEASLLSSICVQLLQITVAYWSTPSYIPFFATFSLRCLYFNPRKKYSDMMQNFTSSRGDRTKNGRK